jgi:hypothetical protein
MAGFILQVLASAVLLWNFKRNNQFPFSQAISLVTSVPYALKHQLSLLKIFMGFLSFFDRLIGYYVETDQDSLAPSRLKSFDVAILPFL